MTGQPTLATLTEEQLADLIADATSYRDLKKRMLGPSAPAEALVRGYLAPLTDPQPKEN